MTNLADVEQISHHQKNAEIIARLERLPVTGRLQFMRITIGIATFFDAYTVLAIAFALPQLITEWHLTPAYVGAIIAAGYVGQLVGAIFFGSLAEKVGRLKVLSFTILLFVAMDISCLFAWSGMSLLIFRFLQGVGTGGEVPVASAYINEFIGAEKRGKFFLLYEVLFPMGLMFAGMAAFFLMPIYGWKVMFIVGLIPSLLVIPLRFSCLSHHAGWLQKVVLKKPIKSSKALKMALLKAVKLCLNLWLKKLTRKAWQKPTGASCSVASTANVPLPCGACGFACIW